MAIDVSQGSKLFYQCNKWWMTSHTHGHFVANYFCGLDFSCYGISLQKQLFPEISRCIFGKEE